jgi:polyisoprenoid-binding protein YceI
MKYLQLLSLAAFVATSAIASDKPAPAPSGIYVSDPAHSSLTWKINHLGLSNFTARFTAVSAELVWDAANPTGSKVTAVIDPVSVRTDFPFPEKEDFDKEIGTTDNFLAGKEIRFVSSAVRMTGDNHGEVAGDLTFRGQTHPVTLMVTFNGSMAEQPREKTPKIGFSAEAKLKRSEWGVAPQIKSIGDEVTVIIETEFMPQSKKSD